MIYVLIVDDDEDDRDLFCDAVGDVDPTIRCVRASNGEEALIGLRNGLLPRPDLIFLDLNMPRIDGVQCLKQLKSDEHLRTIPVAIYSTSKLAEDRDAVMKLGAVHFITKPNTLKELCDQISFVLEKEHILRSSDH